MLNYSRKFLKLSDATEHAPYPQIYIVEPIWEQHTTLLLE